MLDHGPPSVDIAGYSNDGNVTPFVCADGEEVVVYYVYTLPHRNEKVPPNLIPILTVSLSPRWWWFPDRLSLYVLPCVVARVLSLSLCRCSLFWSPPFPLCCFLAVIVIRMLWSHFVVSFFIDSTLSTVWMRCGLDSIRALCWVSVWTFYLYTVCSLNWFIFLQFCPECFWAQWIRITICRGLDPHPFVRIVLTYLLSVQRAYDWLPLEGVLRLNLVRS